ncbi:hypothetical protein RUND412_011498 [Rhizina undulata]
MLSFLASRPPRTKSAHQNPLVTGGGRGSSTTEFLPISNVTSQPPAFLVRQTLPPAPSSNTPSTAKEIRYPPVVLPPHHWHGHQTENFLVEKGVMKVTLDGVTTYFTAGEEFVVDPEDYHYFINASSQESLQVVFSAFPANGGADEKFFRNIFSYQDDCRKRQASPSLPQMLLFMYDSDTCLALDIPLIPRLAQKALSRALNFVGGVVIGELLLGYKRSYPEYYEEKRHR